MTRPSPLQVLDANMPKWAAGDWKPGDAAGVLAALGEAGYVVVERERAIDVKVVRQALRNVFTWMEYNTFYRPDPYDSTWDKAAAVLAAEYTRLAEERP